MIRRDLENVLATVSTQYPVVTVTGPRQSGKTTLCRAYFTDHQYVSLERPDVREFARDDPNGFLAQFPGGVILDEVQHVPELLSYIQVRVDEDDSPGRYVLTGSQHFGLSAAISQSLAGRTTILTLLPPSLRELRRFDGVPDDIWELVRIGAYPRIWDHDLDATRWLADYTATYIQRDVREVVNVGNLEAFSTFLRLVAGRTAEEVNLSKLGGDAGVSHNTARAWLSVLETSYVVFRLSAFHANLRKQIIKAPKLHFFDSGIVCYLLGIRTRDQLLTHPLRGSIFESWVVSEVYKSIVHAGLSPRLFHYRESRGVEVDLIVEDGGQLIATEVKSGETIRSSFLRNLHEFRNRLEDADDWRDVRLRVVYGGNQTQHRTDVDVIGWNALDDVDWTDVGR